VNFLDTALAYGEGHSEGLIGRVLKERREEVYVATKVPPKNRRWPAPEDVPVSQTYPGDYIVECCEKSLRNLGRDHVDVLQLHTWQDRFLDEDGWRDALLGLKKSGKARLLGVVRQRPRPRSACAPSAPACSTPSRSSTTSSTRARRTSSSPPASSEGAA
jgi:aryl-alcohol dehydrogenase-like predicted oxidoreductase